VRRQGAKVQNQGYLGPQPIPISNVPESEHFTRCTLTRTLAVYETDNEGYLTCNPIVLDRVNRFREGELDAALADADAGLGAEEGIAWLQSLPTSRLVDPEFPEFTHHNASGRKTSPVRPPLAILGRIRRRVRGVLSSI